MADTFLGCTTILGRCVGHTVLLCDYLPDLLLFLELLHVDLIHRVILEVLTRVTPLELVHHVLMLVADQSQTQGLLKAIGSSQGYILIA